MHLTEGHIKKGGVNEPPKTSKQNIKPPSRSVALTEGTIRKGGLNDKPSVPRPESPPKGQGITDDDLAPELTREDMIRVGKGLRALAKMFPKDKDCID